MMLVQSCGGVGIKFSALKGALHVASTARNKLDTHKKKKTTIKELQWMYHRNCFPHGVRSHSHIHRFQSEVPYLISSLLLQGFPEKIEKPRVQLRSLRPRPNNELFIRWTKLIVLDGDWGGGWRFLKRQHCFPRCYLWFTLNFCYALKAFFPGSSRHYKTFKIISTAMLWTPERRLGYVKLYKINIDNWMILLTNHSQLNKSRNIWKYKLTQKK